jgi:FAD/FMN-containing dehydrogenase
MKVCPLGSALSFSNVCLINNQIALDITLLNQVLFFDAVSGIITVQAGVKVTDILKIILPVNYTLAGLTGSTGNTVVGNIANDVNGKDSWKNGNFSANVIAMKIMLSNGDVKEIEREKDADIFNAIIGGLGLIAIILEVTLKLIHIPSYMVRVKSVKHKNLTSVINAMRNLSSENDEFAYCWTDAYSPLKSLGRGISELAVFVESDGSATSEKLSDHFVPRKTIFGFKKEYFWTIIRKTYSSSVHQLAGYLKYYNPLNFSKSVIPFPLYQYPMVKYFPDWNLKFYPHGFREAQLLFSIDSIENAYMEILKFCRKENILPLICSIRKHKEQDGYFSFAGDGFSFSVNYALKGLSQQRRQSLEQGIMDLTLKHKGKSYLGKYPFMNLSAVKAMYPNTDKFIATKKITDPNNILWSDAASIILV